MSNFNAIEFGEKLKKLRKEKGLSQENIAYRLNLSKTTISRFESGELLPNVEQLHIICDELGIYESDLFDRDIEYSNDKNSYSPFDSDKIYIYFNAFNYATKKYKVELNCYLKISKKPGRIEVDLVRAKDNQIYSTGYMYADDSVCFITLKNHLPNRSRLDICELIINIENGVNGLMYGAYFGSNNERYPSLRKCIFSQKEINLTDELSEKLKINKYEMQKLEETHALYLDILNM